MSTYPETNLETGIVYLNHASSAPLVNWAKEGLDAFASRW